MLQPEIVRKKWRFKHEYVCHDCVQEPDELGVYAVAYKRGELRILLEPISLTLFKCPKCHRQFISSDFKKQNNKAEIRRKRKQRIEQLRQIYSFG